MGVGKMAGRNYRHNHYVPEWYQKKFMNEGQYRYYYLDKSPSNVKRGNNSWNLKYIRKLGSKPCFAQDDLYTVKWGDIVNTDIEKFFFGGLDLKAKSAVQNFEDFGEDSIDENHFRNLLRYMSVQKLRTPRGLAWIENNYRKYERNYTLLELQRLQNLFCATWSDCVWHIADASNSDTKFIVSDNSVTAYNRDCFPESLYCKYPNDPDIRFCGTHTIFPLSMNKILILTNLSWVRDPYQSAKKIHPNPRLIRDTVFNFLDIQFDRFLSEEEVIEINYIIKKRSHKYIAAAEEEWLYPEKFIQNDHWRKLGNGYLLMPDPRHVHLGGEVLVGYDNGRSDAWGAYGHKPYEPEYKNAKRDERERVSLYKFKAEWAAIFGRRYRSVPLELAMRDIREDVHELYQVALKEHKANWKNPHKRRRRRALER